MNRTKEKLKDLVLKYFQESSMEPDSLMMLKGFLDKDYEQISMSDYFKCLKVMGHNVTLYVSEQEYPGASIDVIELAEDNPWPDDFYRKNIHPISLMELIINYYVLISEERIKKDRRTESCLFCKRPVRNNKIRVRGLWEGCEKKLVSCPQCWNVYKSLLPTEGTENE